METDVVEFYDPTDGTPQSVLSNYSSHELFTLHVDAPAVFPTVEHYYQSRKFIHNDALWSEEIRKASTPLEATILGRSKRHPVSCFWPSVRVEVMYRSLLIKVSQHRDVRDYLVSTGHLRLLCRAPHDGFWGTGLGGSGDNSLGILWMRVRTALSLAGVSDGATCR